MKKTITVNLNGRVFTMDEDAYRLLDKYRNDIRIYFRKEEVVSEIIADFEARIEALFSERVRLGYEVISVEYVEGVIAKKTFFRNNDNRRIGGVCSGIAVYFNWNVPVVRIVAIVLMLATSFAIVLVYLLLWIIVPAAKTAAEKLQMQGMPITVENIGKTIAAEVEPVKKQKNKGCMEGFIEAIVALMKIGFAGIGCLIGVPLIFALAIAGVILFAVLFGVGGELLQAIQGFAYDTSFLTFDHPVLASIALIFLVGIPSVVLIYSIVAGIANLTPVSGGVKWIIAVGWLLALLLFLGFVSLKIIHINLWH
ncbi:MAG: PspC domain-containing protein [Dysgonamonadaceae bacterium]|jgi:phage shock protein PspC (stress-responsive transcriptional regulator)|nr:PspC domain-containing protein [Dysgonamonadaceae bacterium]